MHISIKSITIISGLTLRASSITNLLLNDSSKDHFNSSHNDIMGSLWAVAELLREIEKEISK